MRQALAFGLVVVDEADLGPEHLHEPDRGGIPHAEIPHRVHREARLDRHPRQPPLRLGLLHEAAVVGAAHAALERALELLGEQLRAHLPARVGELGRVDEAGLGGAEHEGGGVAAGSGLGLQLVDLDREVVAALGRAGEGGPAQPVGEQRADHGREQSGVHVAPTPPGGPRGDPGVVLVEHQPVEVEAAQGVGPVGAEQADLPAAGQIDAQLGDVDLAAGDRRGVGAQVVPGDRLGLVAVGGDVGEARPLEAAGERALDQLVDRPDRLAPAPPPRAIPIARGPRAGGRPARSSAAGARAPAPGAAAAHKG